MCDIAATENNRSLSCVTAMILAGGQGTRLKSVIGYQQKVISDIGGKPFLVKLLEQLNQCGIKKTVLCTGFKGGQVARIIGRTFKNMLLFYSREPKALGTAGALRYAFPKIESEKVLVMNGDSYFPVDLCKVWQWHKNKSAQNTIVLAQVPDVARYGQVCLDSNSNITRFNEKGTKKGRGWINAGIYFLSRACIEGIPVDKNISIEHEVFPLMVGSGLYGYKSKERFIDIGTPESFRLAQKWLKEF